MSEKYISIALLATTIFLVFSPFIYRYTIKVSFKKRIKKAVKEFEQKANEKLKEIEQKKAELENVVKAYDEKLKTVHQLFTELSTITDTQKEKENPKVYIAAKKSFEENREKLNEQINE